MALDILVQLANIQASLAKQQTQLDQLKSRVDGHDTRFNSFQTQINNAVNSVSTVQNTVNQHTGLITTLQNDVKTVKAAQATFALRKDIPDISLLVKKAELPDLNRLKTTVANFGDDSVALTKIQNLLSITKEKLGFWKNKFDNEDLIQGTVRSKISVDYLKQKLTGVFGDAGLLDKVRDLSSNVLDKLRGGNGFNEASGKTLGNAATDIQTKVTALANAHDRTDWTSEDMVGPGTGFAITIAPVGVKAITASVPAGLTRPVHIARSFKEARNFKGFNPLHPDLSHDGIEQMHRHAALVLKSYVDELHTAGVNLGNAQRSQATDIATNWKGVSTGLATVQKPF